MLADAGKAGRVDGEQRANAERAEAEAEHAAGQRQHHALGQQLPNDAAAAGADRRADRDLALAARGAHEQQVRDVGAGDQQHKADRAQQDEQRRPDVADDLVLQQLDAEPVVALEDVGVFPFVFVRREREPRLRLRSVTPSFSRPFAWK